VTGGAGFIGSHVVAALAEAGCAVTVLDSGHPAAHRAPLPAEIGGAPVRPADLRDPAAVDAALSGVDVVVHQAAMVGLGVDLDDLPDYVGCNDLGTAVLLARMARAGVGRLVLASSMVVYGEGGYSCAEHGPVRPGPRIVADLAAGRFEPPCPHCDAAPAPVPVAEDAPLEPRSLYAATKLHQEHLVAAYAREQPDVRAVALRYHNVYGPRMPRDTPYAGVASLFRSALAAGRAPRVFEDGRQLRDFVHVRDVADANLLALTADGPLPAALNVASGSPTPLLTMAELLADAAGPDAPRPVVTGEFRLGDVRHVLASPQLARATLGFAARIGLADGLRELAAAPLRTAA